MSSDNGYILRQDSNGKYVLQMYMASSDYLPDINNPRALRFETLDAAVRAYNDMDGLHNGYTSEYGLIVDLDGVTQPNKKETPMLETQKYARKPSFADAVQVTETNMVEVSKWCKGQIKTTTLETGESSTFIKVQTYRPPSERQTMAFVGDWVLLEGNSFKVYTPKAFSNSFEISDQASIMHSTSDPVLFEDTLLPTPVRVANE